MRVTKCCERRCRDAKFVGARPAVTALSRGSDNGGLFGIAQMCHLSTLPGTRFGHQSAEDGQRLRSVVGHDIVDTMDVVEVLVRNATTGVATFECNDDRSRKTNDNSEANSPARSIQCNYAFNHCLGCSVMLRLVCTSRPATKTSGWYSSKRRSAHRVRL